MKTTPPIKPLTAKQRKVIVASYAAQVLAVADGYMYGDNPDEYISEDDRFKILEMLKEEAERYYAKAGAFGSNANVPALIKAVREQVK